ncbi:MAG TPA: cupredoxin family copper-binding protein [Candidatus Limnocylindrales bacterium]|nr:cupredoxin family copper-binding protein [Candidatus Limnocylindrales bacterium]
MNKKIIILLVVVAVAGLIVISKPQQRSMNGMSSDSKNSSEVVSTNSVSIKNYAFSPKQIKVKKGTTVTWENSDLVPHTVTKAEGSTIGPDSEYFGKGKKYSYTFNDVGVFNYFCKPHPYMKGTVDVTE